MLKIIHKSKINKRSDTLAAKVDALIKMSKKIKDKRKQRTETELFLKFFTERQTMRRTHAFNKWRRYIKDSIGS
jgi:hypothetical protein